VKAANKDKKMNSSTTPHNLNNRYQSALQDGGLPAFKQTGTLGIFQLKRIWQKSRLSRAQKLDTSIAKQEWLLDVMVYDELGLGLEPAIAVVFHSATFEEFEQWILATNDGSIELSLITRLNRNISAFFGAAHNAASAPTEKAYALSEQDWAFWHEHGYLVLPDVIGREVCEAACAAVYEFLHMDADDPDTWYAADERRHQIMVQLFRHPVLSKIRESSAIRDIYRQLWQQKNLWVSTDRVSFNPPERPGWQFPGPHLHWDADLKAPLGFNTQGLVYLTDTTENQGAFTCVPGFHKKIDNWLNSLPPDKNPQQQDWQQWPTKPIAAKAGSLIVWHHALPHGSSPNKAVSPRIVQYVNMRPLPGSQ
jgi:ectoine hydroxylase-related dioxygenase (phytanoyl-CoA dioxygenase family)